jgi:phage terminase large subunit-like protein
MEPERDFASVATQYARDVVGGAVPASRYHRLACERHLRDLARAESGDPDFPYTFNPELLHPQKKQPYRPAQRVCQFAELLPHVKGDWAARGELIVLQPWQVFVLASIFGWIHTGTLKRRFRRADLFVPRKNAKSALAAIIGLYRRWLLPRRSTVPSSACSSTRATWRCPTTAASSSV